MLRVQMMLAQISKPGLLDSQVSADDTFCHFLSSNQLRLIKQKFTSCPKKRSQAGVFPEDFAEGHRFGLSL